jgi:hypothetical protein
MEIYTKPSYPALPDDACVLVGCRLAPDRTTGMGDSVEPYDPLIRSGARQPAEFGIDRTFGRRAFGTDPASYHSVRPQYPDWVFATLVQRCGLGDGKSWAASQCQTLGGFAVSDLVFCFRSGVAPQCQTGWLRSVRLGSEGQAAQSERRTGGAQLGAP